MNNRTTLFLFLFVVISGGIALAVLHIVATMIVIVVLSMIVLTTVFLYLILQRNDSHQDYDLLARNLFYDIAGDLETIRHKTYFVNDAALRQQLELICDDTTVLLEKVTEKMPESRLTTGKFIRGNLDFILSDILPQYIEMQEMPRYYEAPGQSMAEGRDAIAIYARFLHAQIVKLEIPDEMRYAVATEMLKSLGTYLHTEEFPSVMEQQPQ